MDEQEIKQIRGKLERELGSRFLHPAWERFEGSGGFEDYCREDLDWGDFKGLAEDELEYQRKMIDAIAVQPLPRARIRRQEPIEIELEDREREFTDTLAAYLRDDAVLLPVVRQFRNKMLEDGLLSPEEPEQVREFLQDELASYLDYISLDPTYRPEELTDAEDFKDLIGGVADPFGELSLLFPLHNNPQNREAMELARGAVNFRYPYLEGIMEFIRDDDRSLRDLSRWLTTRYPWEQKDAAWFVLTNAPPDVLSLAFSRDPTCHTFTLTFAPWVSEDTILRAYRSAYKGDAKLSTEKSLAVLRFVDEQTPPEEKPQWARLTKLWNEQHPEKTYEERSGGLRKSYEGAKRFMKEMISLSTEEAEEGDQSLPPS
jgi:hypothetical protein